MRVHSLADQVNAAKTDALSATLSRIRAEAKVEGSNLLSFFVFLKLYLWLCGTGFQNAEVSDALATSRLMRRVEEARNKLTNSKARILASILECA